MDLFFAEKKIYIWNIFAMCSFWQKHKYPCNLLLQCIWDIDFRIRLPETLIPSPTIQSCIAIFYCDFCRTSFINRVGTGRLGVRTSSLTSPHIFVWSVSYKMIILSDHNLFMSEWMSCFRVENYVNRTLVLS